MRIGILTFHFECNYGALLQAYGLQSVLRVLGHQPEFINYVPGAYRRAVTGLNRFVRLGWRSYGVAKAVDRGLMMVRCEAFRRRYLKVSSSCTTRAELRAISGRYGALIVGSDQVWNWCWQYGFDPAYLLDFAEGLPCRRISYAACCGHPKQPSEVAPRAAPLLKTLDSISVRNETTADWVRGICGREAVIVADPTLLADYSGLEPPCRMARPYVLLYVLGNRSSEDLASLVALVRRSLRAPVVAVSELLWNRSVFPAADQHVQGVGPRQWLRLFRDASFVITDSFHGAIFCLKYRKPFVVFDEAGTHRSVRLRDVLDRYGLAERLVRSPEDATSRGLLGNPDFGPVAQQMAEHCRISRGFLRNALN